VRVVSMHKKSKIFVGGGTGLVGTSIIQNLIAKGYSNIVTNFHTRKPEILHKTYASYVNNGRLKIDRLDLTDQRAVERFFSQEKPEYVFLAAAKVGGIFANNEFRAEFIYQNLQIQNNVIHQSYLNNIKKLMFLGSTCIYPGNCSQPMKEEYLLTSPLEYTNEPYAIAKIAGIKMCESYNLQYGTNFISVMPTNLYGPNDNFDLEKSHVLPAMIRKIHLAKLMMEDDWSALCKDLDVAATNAAEAILKKNNIFNDKVLLWGTGTPKREFLYSEDMADACVFLMEKVNFADLLEIHKLNAQGEIRNTHINIGTGEEIFIKELSCLVKNIVGYEGQIEFDTSKPDGTLRKLTDVSKLHALGWRHSVSLKSGIRQLYESYLEKTLS